MKPRFSGHRARFARVTITVGLALAGGAGHTQDRAEIDRTQIIGNRELPKVIYIVPWKKPLPGDLASRPPEGVLDEALGPVDRDVFRRQVRYDAQLQARAAADATPAPTSAPQRK